MGIAERKERERQQRRNMIIDAAERIFFSSGLDRSTVDDIAEEAELSKGTLYLYFKSKEDLYLAVTSRGLRIMLKMFKKAFKKKRLGINKLREIGKAYFEFSRKNPDYFMAQMYFDSNIKDFTDETSNARECHLLGEEAVRIVADAVQVGIDDGSIRSDVDPVKTALILWGQSLGVIQLLTMKGKHLKEKHNLFTDEDEVIKYAFELTRISLLPENKGDKK